MNWNLKLSHLNTSGGDGIPAELFQILKDDAVKVLHSIHQQMWKSQQWPQEWKRSVFIPIPKKGNAKECSNHWTIALIWHASKRLYSKSFKPGFNSMWTENFQMYKLDLEMAEELENSNIHCQHPLDHRKARESQKNICFCFIGYTKAFDCMDHNKLWKALNEIGISVYLMSPKTPIYGSRSNS